DVFDDRLKEGGFDVVLAFNLIHLLPEPEAALARVRALLAPEGTFVSKTVCLAGRWYLRPVIGAMRAVGKAPYVHFLSVAKI
ncbi:class I SAM-dependent methyltransferase, partial [Bacillus sp. SIMBA_161]